MTKRPPPTIDDVGRALRVLTLRIRIRELIRLTHAIADRHGLAAPAVTPRPTSKRRNRRAA
jgi:hypothetical protein